MCCLITFWCGLYFPKRSFHCLNCIEAVLEVMHWCAGKGKVFWGCVVGGQVSQSILLVFQNYVAICYRKMHPLPLPKKYWYFWRIRYSKHKFEIKWDKFRGLVVYCHLAVREVLLQVILKICSQFDTVIDCFGWRLEAWKEIIEIFGPHRSIFSLIFLKKILMNFRFYVYWLMRWSWEL